LSKKLWARQLRCPFSEEEMFNLTTPVAFRIKGDIPGGSVLCHRRAEVEPALEQLADNPIEGELDLEPLYTSDVFDEARSRVSIYGMPEDKEEMIKLAKPVAFRVAELASGWVLCRTLSEAKETTAAEDNHRIEPLYTTDVIDEAMARVKPYEISESGRKRQALAIASLILASRVGRPSFSMPEDWGLTKWRYNAGGMKPPEEEILRARNFTEEDILRVHEALDRSSAS
jgi:hypothetical protein